MKNQTTTNSNLNIDVESDYTIYGPMPELTPEQIKRLDKVDEELGLRHESEQAGEAPF